MNKLLRHGEVNLFQVNKIPDGSKELFTKKNFFIVGKSKTHGNDHRVAVNEYVKFFMFNGILFMKNDKPTKIYCPNKSRHDEETIPVGIWEIDKAQEFDYDLMEKRDVFD